MTIILRAVLTVLLFAWVAVPAYAQGTPVTISYSVTGKDVTLTGRLYRPDRTDAAPAVVLMHGCAGVWSLQHEWAKRLQAWGYVALVLDSFTPRGVDAVCEELAANIAHEGNASQRGFDAFGAHMFLSSLDYVDGARIGLIGWSHGAQVAQAVATGAAVNTFLIAGKRLRFQSVIAFYPWCAPVGTIRIPLLILIGEADDWTPASLCKTFAAGQQLMGDPVDLVLYPNATHSFDGTEIGDGIIEYGHVLRYDAVATADAVVRVKDFFAASLAD